MITAWCLQSAECRVQNEVQNPDFILTNPDICCKMSVIKKLGAENALLFITRFTLGGVLRRAICNQQIVSVQEGLGGQDLA